ncbi:MAG: hypothetical protein UW82_C0028G0011 [candidate division WWE3 bacterium GW2011_GWC2_44_9]|uniref:SHOCT domain-containing protein n=2 Tax=Katanobacteria TaxID=422282 RepID=A0A0G1KJZ4_UNCKA|nr:MAG: hypothetical protein UW82_C0028G0011 [candidate division WWE3 bacterium GW2011_GWC2_44_9]
MRKFIFSCLVMLPVLSFTSSTHILTAESSNQQTIAADDHTALEEAEGKDVWDKLQAKQLECIDLTDNNYAVLGEYFMGQSIGDTQRHAVMNQMMTSMMGKEGEKQMHIVMGKRLSGCDTSTQVPSNGVGFVPMMWMMGGWGSFGILGWLSMLLFLVLLILGVVALVRYLARSGQSREDKTPLDILKERYARGEINKKEFEEKKKDPS